MAINWQKYYASQQVKAKAPVADKYSWMKALGFSQAYTEDQTARLTTRIRREVVHELANRRSEDYGVLATPRSKQINAMQYKPPVYVDKEGNEVSLAPPKRVSPFKTVMLQSAAGMGDVNKGVAQAVAKPLNLIANSYRELLNQGKALLTGEKFEYTENPYHILGKYVDVQNKAIEWATKESGYAQADKATKLASDVFRSLPSQGLLLVGGQYAMGAYGIYSVGANLDQYVQGKEPWYEEWGRALIASGMDISTEFMFKGFKSVYTSLMKSTAKGAIQLAEAAAKKAGKDAAKSFVPKMGHFALAILKSMGEEGTEEMVSYAGTSVLDWALRKSVDSKDKEIHFDLGEMGHAGLVGAMSATMLSLAPAIQYHKDLKQIKEYAKVVAEINDMDIKDVTKDVVDKYIKSAVEAAKAMGLDDTASIDMANDVYAQMGEDALPDIESLVIGKEVNDILADPALSKQVWLEGSSGYTWIRSSVNKIMSRQNARWYETALRNHLRKNGYDATSNTTPDQVVKNAAVDMLHDFFNANVEKWKSMFAGNKRKLQKLEEADARLERANIEADSGNPEAIVDVMVEFAKDADEIDETGALKTQIEGMAAIVNSDVVSDSASAAATIAVMDSKEKQELPTQAVDVDSWVRDARAKILRAVGSGSQKKIDRIRKEIEASRIIDDAMRASLLTFLDEKVLEASEASRIEAERVASAEAEAKKAEPVKTEPIVEEPEEPEWKTKARARDAEYTAEFLPIAQDAKIDSITSAEKAERDIQRMKDAKDITGDVRYAPMDILRNKVVEYNKEALGLQLKAIGITDPAIISFVLGTGDFRSLGKWMEYSGRNAKPKGDVYTVDDIRGDLTTQQRKWTADVINAYNTSMKPKAPVAVDTERIATVQASIDELKKELKAIEDSGGELTPKQQAEKSRINTRIKELNAKIEAIKKGTAPPPPTPDAERPKPTTAHMTPEQVKAEDKRTLDALHSKKFANDQAKLLEDYKAYKAQHEMLAKEIDALNTEMVELRIDADRMEKEGHPKKAESMREKAKKIAEQIVAKTQNKSIIYKNAIAVSNRIKFLKAQPASPIRMRRTLVGDTVEFNTDLVRVDSDESTKNLLRKASGRLGETLFDVGVDTKGGSILFEVDHPYQKYFNEFTKMFGTRVVVVSSNNAALNGSYYAFYNNGTIFMNGSIKNAPESVVFHEIVHEMRQISPRMYHQLAKAIGKEMGKTSTWMDRFDTMSEDEDVSDTQLDNEIEEFVGDMVMWVAQNDSTFFKRLTFKHRSLSEMLEDGIAKFRGIISGIPDKGPMAELSTQEIDRVEYAIVSALKTYSYIKTIKKTPSELEVKTRAHIIAEAKAFAIRRLRERNLIPNDKVERELEKAVFWEATPLNQDVVDKIEDVFKVRIVAIGSNNNLINNKVDWAGFNTPYSFSTRSDMSREGYSVVRKTASPARVISIAVHELVHSVWLRNKMTNEQLIKKILSYGNNELWFEEFSAKLHENPLYKDIDVWTTKNEFLAYLSEELLMNDPKTFDVFLSAHPALPELLNDIVEQEAAPDGWTDATESFKAISNFIPISNLSNLEEIKNAVFMYLYAFTKRTDKTQDVFKDVSEIPSHSYIHAFRNVGDKYELKFKKIPAPEGKPHRVVLNGVQYFSKHLTTKMLENYPDVKLESQEDIDKVDKSIDVASGFSDEKIAREVNRLFALVTKKQTAANRKRTLQLLLALAIEDNTREAKRMVSGKDVQTATASGTRRTHQFMYNMLGRNLENLNPSMRVRVMERYAKGDFAMDYMMASNEKAWAESETLDENTVLEKLEETDSIMTDSEAMKVARVIKRMMDSKKFVDNDRATELMAVMSRKLTEAGQFTQAMRMAYNMLFPQMKIIKELEAELRTSKKKKTVDAEIDENKGKIDSDVKQAEVDTAKILDQDQSVKDELIVKRSELTKAEMDRILASRKKKYKQLMQEAWRTFKKLTDSEIKTDWMEQERARRMEEDESIKWTDKMVDQLEKEIEKTWEKNSKSIIDKAHRQEEQAWLKHWKSQNDIELDALKTWDEVTDAERLEEMVYKYAHPEPKVEGEEAEPPKDFDMDKVQEIFKYIKDKFPGLGRQERKTANPYEAVAFLVKHRAAFTELFDEAQRYAYDRYKVDPAEFKRMFSYLQSEMQPVIRTARLNAIIKDGLHGSGFTLEQLIRDYRAGKTDVERSFLSYVIDKTGLSADDAVYLVEALRNQMKVVVAERAKKFVSSSIGVTGKKSQDAMIRELIRIVDFGALHDDAYRRLFAQKVGLPTVTEEQIKLIEDTMNRVGQLDSDKDWREISRLMDHMYDVLSESVPSTAMEKILTLRAMQMLFSPKSWLKNYGGNAIRIPMELTALKLQGMLERKLVKDPTKWTATAKSGVHFRFDLTKEGAKKGLAKTTYDVYDEIAEAVNLQFERYGKPEISKTAKYEMKTRFGKNKKVFRGKDGVSTFLQGAVDVPFAVLEWGDTPFVEYAYKSSMMRFMNSRGLKTITPEAHEFALKYALDATYRTALEMTKVIGWLKRTGPFANLIVSTIQPFVNTGYNIVRVGYQYGPLSLIENVAKFAYQKTSAKIKGVTVPPPDEELLRKLSRGMVGTLMMAIGYMLGLLGYATGAMPVGSDEDKKLWKMLNIKPYSLHFGGSKYVSIDWMNPVAMPFMVGITYAENKVGANFVEKNWNASKEAINAFVRTTVYGNVEQMIGYTDPSDVVFEKLVKSAVYQFTGSLFMNIVKSMQPYVASSYSPEGTSKMVADMLTRLDLIGIVTGKYPTQYDIFGDPVKKGQVVPATGAVGRTLAALMSPFTVNERDASPRAKLLMDVYESARRAGAEDASSALPVEPSGSVNNRTMTKEQYAQYTMTRGRSIKEQVDALLKDPAFMALPDYSAEGISKFAVLQKVYRLASKKAEAEFTITNPLP